MTFGEKIKKARILKGWTQKQLAIKISAKHNSISNWENDQNKPDPDTIEIICGVLGISPNYLLSASHDELSPSHMEIIKKYRSLDAHGKEVVFSILDLEYARICTRSKKK